MKRFQLILLAGLTSLQVCGEDVDILPTTLEPRTIEAQLFRHVEEAGAHFPIPVNTDIQTSLFGWLMRPDFNPFLIAIAPLLKKSRPGLVSDMARNLYALDVPKITRPELRRVLESPHALYVPFTRKALEKVFPLYFYLDDLKPSLITFFENNINTPVAELFLNHLVNLPYTRNIVFEFLFEHLKCDSKKQVFEYLFKTSFSGQAVALFFSHLKTIGDKKEFIKEGLWSAVMLRALRKNRDFLETFTELHRETQEIRKRNHWLDEFITESKKVDYFTRHEFTQEQKFFGGVILFHDPGLRDQCFLQALTQLFHLDYSKGTHMAFALGQDLSLGIFHRSLVVYLLTEFDPVIQYLSKLQNLIVDINATEMPKDAVLASDKAFYSIQPEEGQAFFRIIENTKGWNVSKISQTAQKSFKKRARELSTKLTGFSDQNRAAAMKKIECRMKFNQENSRLEGNRTRATFDSFALLAAQEKALSFNIVEQALTGKEVKLWPEMGVSSLSLDIIAQLIYRAFGKGSTISGRDRLMTVAKFMTSYPLVFGCFIKIDARSIEVSKSYKRTHYEKLQMSACYYPSVIKSFYIAWESSQDFLWEMDRHKLIKFFQRNWEAIDWENIKYNSRQPSSHESMEDLPIFANVSEQDWQEGAQMFTFYRTLVKEIFRSSLLDRKEKISIAEELFLHLPAQAEGLLLNMLNDLYDKSSMDVTDAARALGKLNCLGAEQIAYSLIEYYRKLPKPQPMIRKPNITKR